MRSAVSHATFAELLHELGDVPLERILLRPPIGTATEDDLVAAIDGDDKRLCELVNGVLIEKTRGVKEALIASLLVQYLWAYLEEHDLGIAFTSDGPVRIKPGRIRLPDAFFVSWERLPNEELPESPILDVIPDLAVEVISKGNTKREMATKLKEYFKAGVRLVWFVYPKTETVNVYTSPTAKRTLAKDRTLDGGKVLPGLSLPVHKLFARVKRGKSKS